MTEAYGTEFLPSQRVSNQDWFVQTECCNHGHDIIAQPISIVVCSRWKWGAGSSRPATGDPINVVHAGELWCKSVEAVGVIVAVR